MCQLKIYLVIFLIHGLIQNLFPEFNSNSNGDMYPDDQSNFGGWFM